MKLLEVRGLRAFYGDFQALFGVDLDLAEGESVAVIGANGAGKSTLLESIVGLHDQRAGEIVFAGQRLDRTPAHVAVRRGIALAPEGRRLFPSLSVEENLALGAYAGRPGRWTLERVWRLFPRLRARRDRPATALSGGEQQMVAIGRALMANPSLLLCDEISLGLAPVVIDELYGALGEVSRAGISILLVEQDIGRALRAADRVFCMQEGRIALSGAAATLTREGLVAAYFGT